MGGYEEVAFQHKSSGRGRGRSRVLGVTATFLFEKTATLNSELEAEKAKIGS